MSDVVIALCGSGMRIEDAWLRRIGQAHFGHINFRGTMRFGIERYAESLVQKGGSEVTATARRR